MSFSTCSDLLRLELALGAFFFATGLRFAYLRWRELRSAEQRMREAVLRVELATARIDAVLALGAPSAPALPGDPPPAGAAPLPLPRPPESP